MQYELVADKLGSWAPHFREFTETKAFDDIFKFLRKLTKRGRVVCPAKEHTFNCFLKTDYQDLKAIFLFNGPYVQISDDNIIADGMGLSSSNTGTLTPGLRHFYQAIRTEYADHPDFYLDEQPDLSFLAHQGILLLNAALTSELYKYGSHKDEWHAFMEFFFIEIVNRYGKGLPIVFMGEGTYHYSRYVFAFNHHLFELADPITLPADEVWQSHGVFKAVEQIIRENNPEFQGINWSRQLQEV